MMTLLAAFRIPERADATAAIETATLPPGPTREGAQQAIRLRVRSASRVQLDKVFVEAGPGDGYVTVVDNEPFVIGVLKYKRGALKGLRIKIAPILSVEEYRTERFMREYARRLESDPKVAEAYLAEAVANERTIFPRRW